MSNKKYLIFAPSYNENSGGAIVLHKLCHLLNDLGYEASLFPFFVNYEISHLGFLKSILSIFQKEKKRILKSYRLCASFNTPVIKSLKDIDFDEYIVVYPEIVFGNPLGAKNIVRWFLHQPGHRTGKIYYGKGELYFKFNSAIDDFYFPGSKTSDNELKIIHYPLDIYYEPSVSSVRKGTAYCIRKGRNKKILHDLNGSINIDGKSHEEIANIFRKVELFISYDVYTAYSVFAVLCGSMSVVVPDENMTIDDWYPNLSDRNGIAYGFSVEEINRAKKTRSKVKDYVINEEKQSKYNAQKFVFESQLFFKNT